MKSYFTLILLDLEKRPSNLPHLFILLLFNFDQGRQEESELPKGEKGKNVGSK